MWNFSPLWVKIYLGKQCKYTLSYCTFCYISESKESLDTERKFLGWEACIDIYANSPDFGETCKDFILQTFIQPKMLFLSLLFSLSPPSHLLELGNIPECCCGLLQLPDVRFSLSHWILCCGIFIKNFWFSFWIFFKLLFISVLLVFS